MKDLIPRKILEQHIAVLGKTGSGKTSTAKLMIERVVAERARVCVLDPIKSDWWGLISTADGKKPGLPFHILGGPRGHVPLHASAGKAIAEVVANGALPLSIIDMADFEPGGQARFFVDFAPALLRRMRGVLYLVLEEAHLFAPKERSGIGAENMSIHWAKTLATAGRSKGVRLVLVTQRTQALHNALLGSCDTLIAHRLTAPADQEPAVKWLKANAPKDQVERVASSLSSLPTGTAWVCSGEAHMIDRIAFPRISTYDNTATPTGNEQLADVRTAQVDVEGLRAIVGAAVEEAKANDPAELKRRISQLERQIRERPVIAPAPDNDAVKAAAFSAGYNRAIGVVRSLVDKVLERLHAGMANANRELNEALNGLPAPTMPASSPGAPRSAPALGKPAAPIQRSAPLPRANGHDRLPPGERATLTALIQFPAGLRREQLTVLTQYKRSSRDAYIQRLREKGLVETAGDLVRSTENGMAALPDAAPLPTGVALQEHWLTILPEGERKILRELLAAYPAAIERDALTEITGYARSSRDAYLQRMRAKQLVEEPERGKVRASEDLFA